MHTTKTDVVIIGAGPAGAVAAALLAQKGYKVEVLERQHFPRFSIGESLLAQSIEYIDQAGLLEDVVKHGFQFKDGAAFYREGEYTSIYFPDKSAPGPSTTFQVMRADLDNILAQGAAKKGANIHFGEEVIGFESDDAGVRVTVKNEAGEERLIEARFALDASGFGRVLSRMLQLETPSDFPTRRACYMQVKDNITEPSFDRNKILVSIHPEDKTIWFWLIPLKDGISSVGVVGSQEAIENAGANDHERLWNLIKTVPHKAKVLENAVEHRPAATIIGYAANVKSLYGPSFALLGNAAEFLDPVFSSGVTIAFKSAHLATDLIDRQFKGEAVDWQKEFSDELYVGIDTFRECVDAWYRGSLQNIIFKRPKEMNDVTRQLTSVLAGYAWDRSNMFVKSPRRTMDTIDRWVTSFS
ncbi:MAG TPA: NAD(P)/FAD-dependent oxidoreductase [Terricaulis sp.]|nr:NAD(P)/FAD-dependent oxidoreductase [Terricaulis sp.]